MKLTLTNATAVDVEVPLSVWRTRFSMMTWSVADGGDDALAVSVPLRGQARVFARGSLSFRSEGEATGTETDVCGDLEPGPIFLRHPLTAEPYRRDIARLPVLSRGPPVVTISAPNDWELKHEINHGQIIEFSGRRSGSFMRVGGPFVGFGAQENFGDSRTHFNLRIGYEIAYPTSWLIESVVVESDFQSLVIAPAIEATPSRPWYANVSLGVGLPVRFAEESTLLGVRFQAALRLLLAAFVGTLDYYPALAGDAGVTGAIHGHVSL